MNEIGIGVIFLVLLLGLFLQASNCFCHGYYRIVGFAWLVNWKAAIVYGE